MLLDASQGANRIPRGIDLCPAILPRSRLTIAVDPRKDSYGPRPVFGVESLGLQGIDTRMLPNAEVALSSFQSRQILHGAGNAYSASQVCLGATISVVVFKLPSKPEEVAHRRDLARSLFQRGIKSILARGDG